jgi:hypothetical protein
LVSARSPRWKRRVGGDLVLRDYGTDPSRCVLADAGVSYLPTLVRGLILEGIRKKMSPSERVHFVPILQDAAGWKKVVQFAATEDAYIVVLDSGGQIKWGQWLEDHSPLHQRAT